jgi:heterodisulfide reductase subunit C
MSTHHEPAAEVKSLAGRIAKQREIRVADCYQCGKCTAGCPAVKEMDVAPSQVLRLLQRETDTHDARAMSSRAIWMCVGCETCVTRCPQEVDLAGTMDFLRQEAVERDVAHKDADDVIAFHKAFLKSVEKGGRLFEFGMIGDYKMRTGRFFQDLTVAPSMVAKGKLGFFPHRGANRKEVAEIFARVRKLRKESQV